MKKGGCRNDTPPVQIGLILYLRKIGFLYRIEQEQCVIRQNIVLILWLET